MPQFNLGDKVVCVKPPLWEGGKFELPLNSVYTVRYQEGSVVILTDAPYWAGYAVSRFVRFEGSPAQIMANYLLRGDETFIDKLFNST